MRKLIAILLLAFSLLAACGEIEDDYDEYEYEGDEVIEYEDDDADQRIYIERDDDDYEMEDDD